MATGVREVSVRRGLDLRDFPLVVAGGAGPLHAAAIARELGVDALLVPRESSIFCAEGMLMSDFKHDYVRAYKSPLAAADPVHLRARFDEMSAAGRDTLAREGVTGGAVELRASLDLRYIGQWHEPTVAVDRRTEARSSPRTSRSASGPTDARSIPPTEQGRRAVRRRAAAAVRPPRTPGSTSSTGTGCASTSSAACPSPGRPRPARTWLR
jgi:N-methylhydantoinase A/oxoprolinase/acetone carboxylase beta subunit